MKSKRKTQSVVMEDMEVRQLLSSSLVTQSLSHGVKLRTPRTDYRFQLHRNGAAYTNYQIVTPASAASPNTSGSSPMGLTPSQIRSAYGVNDISFGATVGDGTGETIAIIDAYDDPSFVSSTSSNFNISDLHRFDQQFNLPDPPSFTKLSQTGSTNYPLQNNGWDGEIALDVEWTHAIAPEANIVLVEANSASTTDLNTAINYAKTIPGVVAVTMSYGSTETRSEASADSVYTTPAGHTGITFLASTGDSGAPGEYQAFSPNVVAIGGTSLSVNSSGYSSETGWSDGGGGVSKYELKPTYQSLVSTPSATMRTIPDVSLDANPNTGVAVLDTSASGIGSSNPWVNGYVGGTSLSSPMWAGLIAIADQGRSLAGLGSLDGPSQTLPALYSLPSSDFHDITSGSNGGFSAGAGYDAVTGRGSPIANLLVPALANTLSVNSPTLTLQTDSTGTIDQIYTTAGATGTPAYSIVKSSLAALDLVASTSLTVSLANGNPLSGLRVSYSGDALTLNGSALPDSVTFSNTAVTAGSSSLAISGVQQINFDAAGGLDTVAVNSGPAVNFTASQQLQSLSIASGASVKLDSGNLLLDTQSLSIAAGASMDLTDGTLIDHAGSDFSSIVSELSSGYNSAMWNGAGINSSVAGSKIARALGYAQAGDLGVSSIDGVFVNPNAVVVKYTWYGDANLDGSVNSTDMKLMTAQQTLGKTTWAAGNFNYDNAITADDLMSFGLGSAMQVRG